MTQYKVKKLHGLENKDLKVKQAEPRAVPPDMPRLHFLAAIIGSRGSGKTNAFINLVKMYADTNSFDKVLLFCPTFHNDPKYQLLEPNEHDPDSYRFRVETSYSDMALKEFLDEQRRDINEYKQYLRKKELLEKFYKWRKPIASFPAEELMELAACNFELPETEWKHGMPTALIIFDDLAGNKELYRADSKGAANNFFILHRHLLCSVIFLCQTYKNGVPRQIRNNLSLLMLFSNKSKEMKKEIAAEMSAWVSEEEFTDLWDFCTSESYGFLMVDWDTKDPTRRFRKNFDTLIVRGSNDPSDSDRRPTRKHVPQRTRQRDDEREPTA